MNKDDYEAYLAQKDIAQIQGANQNLAYAPQMAEAANQAQAVLVAETNPNKVIWEIEMSLRNIEQMPDGSYSKLGTPLMNEGGIQRIRFIMRSVVNQNTILSHLDEKVIGKLVMNLANNIVDDLTLNWRQYDIQDKTMLDHIVDAVIYPAYFALMRAYGQNEKNWLGRVTVENINGGANRSPAPSKSWFDKFKL